MGSCRLNPRKLAKCEADDINQRLEKVQKWARKERAGSDKPKHRGAEQRRRLIAETGCKTSCCAKPPGKLCKRCPKRWQGLIMAPIELGEDAVLAIVGGDEHAA